MLYVVPGSMTLLNVLALTLSGYIRGKWLKKYLSGKIPPSFFTELVNRLTENITVCRLVNDWIVMTHDSSLNFYILLITYKYFSFFSSSLNNFNIVILDDLEFVQRFLTK